MRKLLPFALLLLSYTNLLAGNDLVPIGARAAGLANASVGISDVWSVNNNIAGIAAIRNMEVGAYAENRFGLKAFTTVALQGVLPVGESGAVGAELYRFGDKYYNEQRLGVGYAHKLGQVSLGIKADLLQVHAEDLGSKRVVILSFGGQSEIVPDLTVAAHIQNLNQAKLADSPEGDDERVPTVMTAGISYRPGSKIMLNLETEKNIDLPADFKAGIEYLAIEKLSLRTGFSTLSQTATFGAGFKARAFQVDYALGTTSRLGISNHVSVSYKFE